MNSALRLSRPLPHPDASPDDFVARREKIMKEGQNKPIARVAALLEFLSRRNADEGRDPYLITDDLSCAFIVELLGLSKQQLSETLQALEARKLLVTTKTGSLRLTSAFCPQSRAR